MFFLVVTTGQSSEDVCLNVEGGFCIPDGEFDRCISFAIATGKALCVSGMFNSTTGTVRGALPQSFFPIAGHLKIHLTFDKLSCDSDKIIRLC